MLQNEPTAEQTIPTGQNRVTPDELNRAVAAIESRRQAEAQRLAGTLPIDQAVSELHLGATSDEIWAEVQAQRAKAAQREQMPQAGAAQRHSQTTRHGKRDFRWMAMFTPLLLLWVMLQSGVVPHFWSHPASMAAPILRPLAQIPDGKEVFADDSALAQVSQGKPTTQITISENVEGNRWTLVKIAGHVYLRGFVAYTDSLQTLQGRALKVTNDDDLGELKGVRTSNVTLRVDQIPLQKSGGDDGYSEIIVPNFQPDSLTTLNAGR